MSKNQTEVLDLHVKKIGQGPNKLLFFHGFGQDHKAFESYFDDLKSTQTIYAFDLPYHGRSEWSTQKVDTIYWRATMESFLSKENIDRFSIVAFSLGGRFAIQSFIHFFSKIDHMILVAPDGVYKSFWYRVANSLIFKPLFHYLMVHDGEFERFLRLIGKTQLVPKTLISFSKKELSSPTEKLRVYHVWTSLRPLQVSNSLLLKTIRSSSTSFDVVLGTKDYIIHSTEILKKIKPSEQIQIHHLPSKHHHLISEAEPLIISLIQRDIT